MADIITKTTEQWDAISTKSTIIPINTTCVEIITDKVMKIKMGDGKHTFDELPYIDNDASDVVYRLYQTEHPKNIHESNVNYKKRLYNGWTNDVREIYTKRFYANEIDNMKTIPKIIQTELSVLQMNINSQFKTIDQSITELFHRKYLTIDDVKDFINTIKDDITHTHHNKNILDETTASFTVAYKNQLDHLKNITYDTFIGATSETNGTTGLVPAPLIKDRNSFLRGDGTWAVIDNVDIDLSNIDASTVNGHTINKDVPSNAVFTDTTYTASSPLSISNKNVISINLTEYATQAWVNHKIDTINIPTLDGYATEAWVINQIRTIDLSDLDLTQYATKDYVDTAIATIEPSEPFDPTGYATEAYVDNAINNINIPTVVTYTASSPLSISNENNISIDLSNYATQTWVTNQINTIDIPDLDGYATETYVDNAIDEIVFPTDATTVNHHTVLSDVPANAVFTDTVYTLPNASDTTLGGVIIGEGLNITNDGTLSVDSTIIPTVPTELGVMEIVPKQNEAGILTKTKAGNIVEDIDVLQYLNTITLHVGFTA